jgi:hypothetical protein
MVVREWKCTCPPDTLDGFIGYLIETGVKDTQTIDGCCGYRIMKRTLPHAVEITLLTFWKTVEQMKAYAGEAIDKAVLYPEDHLYGIVPETDVKLYDIVDERFIA